MFKTTDALVLREVRYKEADRILSLFTPEYGKITAKARGAVRKSSRIAAATQQLTYAEMTLFGNKGHWSVNEAVVKEPFEGLRQDIGAFSLGCYFAECLDAVCMEEEPEPAILQLCLNSLYALSRGLYSSEHIKLAFELRLMCLTGYEPALSHCADCGDDCKQALFALDKGCIYCERCRSSISGRAAYPDEKELETLRYVVSAPAKRIFSFELPEKAERRLSDITEEYLCTHTERKFATLEYWKKLK